MWTAVKKMFSFQVGSNFQLNITNKNIPNEEFYSAAFPDAPPPKQQFHTVKQIILF